MKTYFNLTFWDENAEKVHMAVREFKPYRMGKYLLLDHIASGGMAELFKAKTVGAGGFEKIVAVKSIYPQYINNEDFRRMFEREAQICSQLQHANIVQIYDFIRIGENFLLAMEFVDGKNARQILGKAEELREKIPVNISAHVVLEMCRGLDYAHKKKDGQNHEPLNIIHRDISPQNVMVSYEGAVKLVDFGIAKSANKAEITRSGVVKGKFAYMSPEQASASGQIDHRSDIFALGIVLYELLTQERLFMGDDDLQTLKKINDCKVPKVTQLNPSVPYELEKIVSKALSREPELRYQTAGEMAKALQAIVVKKWEDTTSEAVGQWVRKLFAKEVLEERKRFENQEQMARVLGREALESVRDTLMPTDGEHTNIRDHGETKITQPSDTADGNQEKKSSLIATRPVSQKVYGEHERTKPAVTPPGPMPTNSPSNTFATTQNSGQSPNLNTTQSNTKLQLTPGQTANKAFPANTKGITLSSNGRSTTQEVSFNESGAGPLKLENGKVVNPSLGGGGGPKHTITNVRATRPKIVAVKKSSGPSPAAAGLLLLLIGGGAYWFTQSKHTTTAPPSQLTQTGDVGQQPTAPTDTSKLPTPAPASVNTSITPQQIQEPQIIDIPPETLTPQLVPDSLKAQLTAQKKLTLDDVRGHKIQVGMYPEGTQMKLGEKVVGLTPFVWVVPTDLNDHAQITFSKSGAIGLKLSFSQLVELLLDRRSGTGKNAGTYDYLFEFNLRSEQPSIIEIYVQPSARIYINGQFVGNSPLRNHSIRGGRHSVKFENPTLNLSREVSIEVQPGKKNPPFEFKLN